MKASKKSNNTMSLQYTPIVSIIVPAYNAQNYIADCINSVIDQTFSQWELLLIDDGSTDQTPALIDDFAKKDPRIFAFHQKNKGVSAARNKGLDQAAGEYIVFLDADDLLTPNSLETRIETIQGADMVIGGITFTDNNGNVIMTTPNCPRKVWTGEDILRIIVVSGEAGYQGYTFNKLFYRSIIEDYNIRFIDGIAYNEDRLFCAMYALHCTYVSIIDEIVYLYRQTPTGAMESLNKMQDTSYRKIMSEFSAFDILMELLNENHKSCYYLTSAEALGRAVVLRRMAPKTEKRLKRGFSKAIRKYGVVVLSAPQNIFPLKKRFKLFAHTIFGC